jgi:hypothetical protein
VPGYQQISSAATGLLTDVPTLMSLNEKGWIRTQEKNGSVFIAADQRYRAKYILHLRNEKHLSDEQIELVLSVQRPPYSSAEVETILKEHAPARDEAGPVRRTVPKRRADGSGVA